MKDLYTYIDECGEGCATPTNTMGMGDVMLPDGENLGVDGIPKKKRNKKTTTIITIRATRLNFLFFFFCCFTFLICLCSSKGSYSSCNKDSSINFPN